MSVVNAEPALEARLRTVAAASSARGRRAVVVARTAVYGGAVLYGLSFAAIATLNYLSYHEARLDLGDMVQAIWSTAHGHFLQTTAVGGHDVSRLGAHVDPILVLLVPLWLLWSSPVMLLVVQALAVAAGALPVYWLARKHLGSERAGVFLAFAYLLYPCTQVQAFTLGGGFHPVTLAVPLILYAIWFLDQDRLLPFALFAVLAATTKEEIPAAIGFLGLWYAIRRGRTRVGLTILALGIAATAVNFLVIIPHFAPAGFHPFADRYGAVGGSAGGIAHTAVTHPVRLLHAVATAHKLGFLLFIFVPLLGFWLLEPWLLLGAVPDVVINLLSSKPEQTNILFQYTAGIIPFVIAATIFGIKRSRWQSRRAAFLVLAATACIAFYSPFVYGAHHIREVSSFNAVHRAKERALSMIPAGVAVSASNELGGYLSERPHINTFPAVHQATWVIVDHHDGTYGPNFGPYRRALRRLELSPRWRLAYSSHGVQVFRRR
jgi:uncharacterized membrane protein